MFPSIQSGNKHGVCSFSTSIMRGMDGCSICNMLLSISISTECRTFRLCFTEKGESKSMRV